MDACLYIIHLSPANWIQLLFCANAIFNSLTCIHIRYTYIRSYIRTLSFFYYLSINIGLPILQKKNKKSFFAFFISLNCYFWIDLNSFHHKKRNTKYKYSLRRNLIKYTLNLTVYKGKKNSNCRFRKEMRI